MPMIRVVEMSPEGDMCLVGSKNDVATFSANIGSIALGALSQGEITVEQTTGLFDSLQMGFITTGLKPLLGVLSEKSSVYRNHRLSMLTLRAAVGGMDSLTLLNEYKRLSDFGLNADETDQNHEWVGYNGLLGDIDSYGFISPYLETADNRNFNGFEDDIAALSELTDIQLDAMAFQQQMYPASGEQGRPLPTIGDPLWANNCYGFKAEDGSFTPVVNVLGADYFKTP